MRKELERKIQEEQLEKCFVLLGIVENPYKMLCDCDIYIQPSQLESFGLTVNEAKIFHKPIVCSDIPAFHEQIESGINGLIVKENSPAGFADAIYQYIRDPKFANHCREQLASVNSSHFEAVDIFNRLATEDKKQK